MNYHIHNALSSLRPDAEWTIAGNNLSGIIWHDEDQDRPTDSEINAEVSRLTTAEPLRLLRLERNKRLLDTDWWAVSDRTITDAETTYRQALRDLPANTDDPANPSWPELG
tara:strand:+ start:278 stop:610 length:333 start_codon:yes stop_codon:yes gene_type:complete